MTQDFFLRTTLGNRYIIIIPHPVWQQHVFSKCTISISYYCRSTPTGCLLLQNSAHWLLCRSAPTLQTNVLSGEAEHAWHMHIIYVCQIVVTCCIVAVKHYSETDGKRIKVGFFVCCCRCTHLDAFLTHSLECYCLCNKCSAGHSLTGECTLTALVDSCLQLIDFYKI